MSIFEKVAIAHNTAPEEVEAEIEAALEFAGVNVEAEEFINRLAALFSEQQKSRG